MSRIPEFSFMHVNTVAPGNTSIVSAHILDPRDLQKFIGRFMDIKPSRTSTTPIELDGVGILDMSTMALGHMAVYYADPVGMRRLVCHDYIRDFLLKRNTHHGSERNTRPIVDTAPIDIRQKPPSMNDAIGLPGKYEPGRTIHAAIAVSQPSTGLRQRFMSKPSLNPVILINDWSQFHTMLPNTSENTYTRIVGYEDTGRIIT